jgi:hypothetical protein
MATANAKILPLIPELLILATERSLGTGLPGHPVLFFR